MNDARLELTLVYIITLRRLITRPSTELSLCLEDVILIFQCRYCRGSVRYIVLCGIGGSIPSPVLMRALGTLR